MEYKQQEKALTKQLLSQLDLLVQRCYDDKKDLFVNLDQEKLNTYIDSAKNDAERLILWEQEKG